MEFRVKQLLLSSIASIVGGKIYHWQVHVVT